MNGTVTPAQVALQGMRNDTSNMTVPRVLELLEVQQRVQLLEYAQRAQHYQRLHAAAILPIAGRVLPTASTTLQSHPTAAALGCSGLLSFIYSKLQDVGSPSSPSHQQLRFLQAAAAAAPTACHDEPKPSQSYIGLIAMAILSSKERKLVLSDIYQWILDHFAYFRYRGPGWRNSIRHNLSLNDCFVKAGRSANGKGHYWAIHPANVDDFERGDFRRRRAQRKVRRAMGLSVPDDDDSPGSSPSVPPVVGLSPSYCSWTPNKSPSYFYQRNQPLPTDWNHVAAAAVATGEEPLPLQGAQDGDVYRRDLTENEQSNATCKHQPRVKRRLFDMESILAPDNQLTKEDTRTVNNVFTRHQKCEDHNFFGLLDDNAESEYKVLVSVANVCVLCLSFKFENLDPGHNLV